MHRSCPNRVRAPTVVGCSGYACGVVDRALLEQAKNSSVEERLAIIGELWDSIDHSKRPVSPSVAALIDERVADAKANPLDSRPWDEVQQSLRERRSR